MWEEKPSFCLSLNRLGYSVFWLQMNFSRICTMPHIKPAQCSWYDSLLLWNSNFISLSPPVFPDIGFWGIIYTLLCGNLFLKLVYLYPSLPSGLLLYQNTPQWSSPSWPHFAVVSGPHSVGLELRCSSMQGPVSQAARLSPTCVTLSLILCRTVAER